MTIKIAMCHPSDICHHGGIETHIRCLTKSLIQHGHQVDLFCPIDPSVDDADNQWRRREFSCLQPQNYDIIHTHGGDIHPWSMGGYLLQRNAQQRHVHTTHNVGMEYLIQCRTPLNWRCYAATLQEGFWSRYADHVITVSHSSRNWAIRWFGIRPDNVTWIPNGSWPVTADSSVRDKLRSKMGLGENDFAGIFVGRGYDRVKGTYDITRAYHKLYLSFPQLKLLALPGSGFDDAPWLIKTGPIAHQDIWQYYLAADFFINASFSEGLPLTLVEAMATGLPVIAARVGGIPDIIQHRVNGLLIAEDRSDISDLIVMLLGDKQLRESLAKQELMTARNLTWSKIAEQTIKIYQRVLN